MPGPRLQSERLELFPLAPAAAAALPDDRAGAAAAIGAELSPDWPGADLFDVLPLQSATGAEQAQYGVWVIVERQTGTVVGDVGFLGPPRADGTVEIGYSVVPGRRRRGYATEAVRALLAWVREQPGVDAIVARCDLNNAASIRTLERVGFSRRASAHGQLHWRLDSRHAPS